MLHVLDSYECALLLPLDCILYAREPTTKVPSLGRGQLHLIHRISLTPMLIDSLCSVPSLVLAWSGHGKNVYESLEPFIHGPDTACLAYWPDANPVSCGLDRYVVMRYDDSHPHAPIVSFFDAARCGAFLSSDWAFRCSVTSDRSDLKIFEEAELICRLKEKLRLKIAAEDARAQKKKPMSSLAVASNTAPVESGTGSQSLSLVSLPMSQEELQKGPGSVESSLLEENKRRLKRCLLLSLKRQGFDASHPEFAELWKPLYTGASFAIVSDALA